MPVFIIPVAVVAALVLFVVFMLWTFWKTPKADEALVITGWRPRVVTTGGALVLPVFQRVQRLSLAALSARLEAHGNDKQMIPIGVKGNVVFKVGSDEQSILSAAERFIDELRDTDTAKMVDFVQQVVHGHLRSMLGDLTIEEVIGNRGALAEAARNASMDEMSNMGLIIDSLQVQEVIDPTGYIEAKGKPRAAQAHMEAKIAEAQRAREAAQAEEEARRQIATAQQETALQAASLQAERDAQQAKAEQARPLAEAEARREVVQRETDIAELEAKREERRLVSSIQKPAEAKAAAQRTQAEADAYARRQAADAAAAERSVTGQAEATIVRLNGEAEAAALEQKMLAEAKGIAERGKALQIESEAVISQQVAEKLPEIVAAAAQAFGNIDNLTVLNGAQGITEMLSQVVGQAGPLLDVARKTLTTATKASSNGHVPEETTV